MSFQDILKRLSGEKPEDKNEYVPIGGGGSNARNPYDNGSIWDAPNKDYKSTGKYKYNPITKKSEYQMADSTEDYYSDINSQQIDKLTNGINELGGDIPEPEGANPYERGGVQKIFDALFPLGYGVENAIMSQIDNDPNTTLGDSFLKGIKSAYSDTEEAAKNRVTGQDLGKQLLENDPNSLLGKGLNNFWGGLAADMLLDPTSYFTGPAKGLALLGKGSDALKAADKIGDVTKARKILEGLHPGTEVTDAQAQRLFEQTAKSMGYMNDYKGIRMELPFTNLGITVVKPETIAKIGDTKLGAIGKPFSAVGDAITGSEAYGKLAGTANYNLIQQAKKNPEMAMQYMTLKQGIFKQRANELFSGIADRFNKAKDLEKQVGDNSSDIIDAMENYDRTINEKVSAGEGTRVTNPYKNQAKKYAQMYMNDIKFQMNGLMREIKDVQNNRSGAYDETLQQAIGKLLELQQKAAQVEKYSAHTSTTFGKALMTELGLSQDILNKLESGDGGDLIDPIRWTSMNIDEASAYVHQRVPDMSPEDAQTFAIGMKSIADRTLANMSADSDYAQFIGDTKRKYHDPTVPQEELNYVVKGMDSEKLKKFLSPEELYKYNEMNVNLRTADKYIAQTQKDIAKIKREIEGMTEGKKGKIGRTEMEYIAERSAKIRELEEKIKTLEDGKIENQTDIYGWEKEIMRRVKNPKKAPETSSLNLSREKVQTDIEYAERMKAHEEELGGLSRIEDVHTVKEAEENLVKLQDKLGEIDKMLESKDLMPEVEAALRKDLSGLADKAYQFRKKAEALRSQEVHRNIPKFKDVKDYGDDLEGVDMEIEENARMIAEISHSVEKAAKKKFSGKLGMTSLKSTDDKEELLKMKEKYGEFFGKDIDKIIEHNDNIDKEFPDFNMEQAKANLKMYTKRNEQLKEYSSSKIAEQYRDVPEVFPEAKPSLENSTSNDAVEKYRATKKEKSSSDKDAKRRHNLLGKIEVARERLGLPNDEVNLERFRALDNKSLDQAVTDYTIKYYTRKILGKKDMKMKVFDTASGKSEESTVLTHLQELSDELGMKLDIRPDALHNTETGEFYRTDTGGLYIFTRFLESKIEGKEADKVFHEGKIFFPEDKKYTQTFGNGKDSVEVTVPAGLSAGEIYDRMLQYADKHYSKYVSGEKGERLSPIDVMIRYMDGEVASTGEELAKNKHAGFIKMWNDSAEFLKKQKLSSITGNNKDVNDFLTDGIRKKGQSEQMELFKQIKRLYKDDELVSKMSDFDLMAAVRRMDPEEFRKSAQAEAGVKTAEKDVNLYDFLSNKRDAPSDGFDSKIVRTHYEKKSGKVDTSKGVSYDKDYSNKKIQDEADYKGAEEPLVNAKTETKWVYNKKTKKWDPKVITWNEKDRSNWTTKTEADRMGMYKNSDWKATVNGEATRISDDIFNEVIVNGDKGADEIEEILRDVLENGDITKTKSKYAATSHLTGRDILETYFNRHLVNSGMSPNDEFINIGLREEKDALEEGSKTYREFYQSADEMSDDDLVSAIMDFERERVENTRLMLENGRTNKKATRKQIEALSRKMSALRRTNPYAYEQVNGIRQMAVNGKLREAADKIAKIMPGYDKNKILENLHSLAKGGKKGDLAVPDTMDLIDKMWKAADEGFDLTKYSKEQLKEMKVKVEPVVPERKVGRKQATYKYGPNEGKPIPEDVLSPMERAGWNLAMFDKAFAERVQKFVDGMRVPGADGSARKVSMDTYTDIMKQIDDKLKVNYSMGPAGAQKLIVGKSAVKMLRDRVKLMLDTPDIPPVFAENLKKSKEQVFDKEKMTAAKEWLDNVLYDLEHGKQLGGDKPPTWADFRQAIADVDETTLKYLKEGKNQWLKEEYDALMKGITFDSEKAAGNKLHLDNLFGSSKLFYGEDGFRQHYDMDGNPVDNMFTDYYELWLPTGEKVYVDTKADWSLVDDMIHNHLGNQSELTGATKLHIDTEGSQGAKIVNGQDIHITQDHSNSKHALSHENWHAAGVRNVNLVDNVVNSWQRSMQSLDEAQKNEVKEALRKNGVEVDDDVFESGYVSNYHRDMENDPNFRQEHFAEVGGAFFDPETSARMQVLMPEVYDSLKRSLASMPDDRVRMAVPMRHNAKEELMREIDYLKRMGSIVDYNNVKNYVELKGKLENLKKWEEDTYIKAGEDWVREKYGQELGDYISQPKWEKYEKFMIQEKRYIDNFSDEVKATAEWLREEFGDMATKEEIVEIANYIPHVLNPQLAKKEQAKAVKAMADRGVYIKDPKNMHSIHRTMPGSIKKLNEKMKAKYGIDNFFDTNITRLYLKRAINNEQYLYRQNVLNDVLNTFGHKVMKKEDYAGLDNLGQQEAMRNAIRQTGDYGDANIDSMGMSELWTVYRKQLTKMRGHGESVFFTLNPSYVKKDSQRVLSDQDLAQGTANRNAKRNNLRNAKAGLSADSALNEVLDFEIDNPMIEIDPTKLSKADFYEYMDEGTYVMPKAAYEAYQKEMQKQFREEKSAFVKAFNKMTRIFKVNATQVNPSFHFNNTVGNLFNSWLYAGGGILRPDVIKESFLATKAHNGLGKDAKMFNGMTAQEFVIFARKHGILENSFSNENNREFLQGKLDSLTKKGSLRNKARYINPMDEEEFLPYKVGKKIGGNIEDSSKLSNFIYWLKKGKSPEEAADLTNKVMFDYQDLSDFEHRVMKNIIPFYTWMRKNIPLQLETMMEQPEKYLLVRNAYNEFNNGKETEQEAALRPEYLDNSLKLGDGKYFNLNLPSNDLAKLGNWKDMYSSLNPLAKLAIELPTNKNVYYDSPIQSNEYADDERVPYALKSLVPSIGKLMKASDMENPTDAMTSLINPAKTYEPDFKQLGSYAKSDYVDQLTAYKQALKKKLAEKEANSKK